MITSILKHIADFFSSAINVVVACCVNNNTVHIDLPDRAADQAIIGEVTEQSNEI